MTAAAAVVALSGPVRQRLPERWATVVPGVVGATAAGLTRAPLGLRPRALRGGLRAGGLAAAAAAAGVLAVSAVPRVRAGMTRRELPDTPARWLLVRIPLGTVWSEELLYRGALAHLAAEAFGPTGGRLLQAAAFGLSHVSDARATGEPIAATVLSTGAAGWVFAWLAERSGSVAAPMLVHLALNEAGALAVLAARCGRY
ncbi:CPBP family intramembrane glutamic endopeptidase [Mycobacterium sp. GA-2829]|uniref:Rv0804 family intramembrane glutamic endopeptidase n=1 Tax=Mycobacterium sp. GA-2829 TaxID=1772283 RepID=UPI0009E87488|nr:CPBP family intramembrane glutamic endopeptidase [Mycobacterium sp. GA-2829]